MPSRLAWSSIGIGTAPAAWLVSTVGTGAGGSSTRAPVAADGAGVAGVDWVAPGWVGVAASGVGAGRSRDGSVIGALLVGDKACVRSPRRSTESAQVAEVDPGVVRVHVEAVA